MGGRVQPQDILHREQNRQAYYQRRNAQSISSHTKTRIQLYTTLGIDVDKIKSCVQTI